jgi:hypothetical protein
MLLASPVTKPYFKQKHIPLTFRKKLKGCAFVYYPTLPQQTTLVYPAAQPDFASVSC